MPKQRSITFLAVQNYPLKVPDLKQAELQALIKVLAIEPPRPTPPLYGENTKQQIREAVSKLPLALRKRSLIFSPSSSVAVATLCTTHKRLNQYIIGHIFRLIQREVEDHLDIIIERYPGYPENLQSHVFKIVRNLQSLRGLWWDLQSSRKAPINPIPFQQNKCEACMISRAIASPEALRDLRTALLSRTRERCSYRPPPKLSRFVDGALYHRHGKSLQSLIQSSTKLSSDLKRARKDAARRTSRQHSRRCDGTKCEPRLPSRTVSDRQLISKPPEEPSGSSPTTLNPNFDPNRRPSSQTIKFCLVTETVSPSELAKKLQEEHEDEEQHKIQDLLIQEILSAYGPLRSSLRVTASLNLNSRYLSYISTTPRYSSNSTNYSPRESLSDLPIWEDDWDERSIAINPGSPVVDQLIDQIGSLLIDNAGGDEPESGRSSRKISIVSPPMPYKMTLNDYLERGAEQSGWYDSDESSAQTVTDPRKSSGTTTWSMILDKSQQSRGKPHNSYRR
ncbi:hypothetical protein BDW75DRAFT_244382 [Aspergillus navahoensis]